MTTTIFPISDCWDCICGNQLFRMNSVIGIIPRQAINTRRRWDPEVESFTVFKPEGILITNLDIFDKKAEVWYDGPHTLADVYCKKCKAFKGFKYIAGPANKDSHNLQGHFLMAKGEIKRNPLIQEEEQRDNIDMPKRDNAAAVSQNTFDEGQFKTTKDRDFQIQ